MPKGVPATGSRAARTTRNITLYGLGVDRRYIHGGTALFVDVAHDLRKFSEDVVANFDEVLKRWADKYATESIRNAAAGSAFVRSKRLQTMAMERVTGVNTKKGASWVFRAKSPDPEVNVYGATLERGREQKSPEGSEKYYLVPLASWIQKSGQGSGGGQGSTTKKFITSQDIARDLGQTEGTIQRGPRKGQPAPRSFMLRTPIDTSTGKARLILLYHKGRKRRSPWTGKFVKKNRQDTLGRKITKGKLREIATAMYLAYTGVRGIFSTGTTVEKKKGRPSPLAARFGLTETTTAPNWFTRGGANALAGLYNAIMTETPKFPKGSGKTAGGTGKVSGATVDITQLTTGVSLEKASVVTDSATAYDDDRGFDIEDVSSNFVDSILDYLDRQKAEGKG